MLFRGEQENLRDFVAVLLSEREKPDLVDRPQVACCNSQGNMSTEFADPEATSLNVHLLPTGRLDVGVRNVAGTHLPLASDCALGHGARKLATPIRCFNEFLSKPWLFVHFVQKKLLCTIPSSRSEVQDT